MRITAVISSSVSRTFPSGATTAMASPRLTPNVRMNAESGISTRRSCVWPKAFPLRMKVPTTVQRMLAPMRSDWPSGSWFLKKASSMSAPMMHASLPSS